MTNVLVGDVYQKIIEEVIAASSNDFEESGVSQTTLQELQQEWHQKLSYRDVARMPWEPKPAPPMSAEVSTPTSSLPSATNNNGLSNSYTYDSQTNGADGDDAHIKSEPGTEGTFANGYSQPPPAQQQGGLLRAQQLVQQYAGSAANATVNAMQRGSLALPGQQPRAQALQLPGQQSIQQQQYANQQVLQQRQQMQQQQARQQQDQSKIKVENDSPSVPSAAGIPQTDGADDSLDEWKAMLAQRRATGVEKTAVADKMMRDHITQITAALESGLMMPLDEKPRRPSNKKRRVFASMAEQPSSSAPSSIPQYDGDADDDGSKSKDEDDEDAINSDLDDSEDEAQGNMGDDEDENGDSILCTYDKVQRVKNKWKCILKDGIMSVGGKEYVFHKATGEFEW